MDLSDFKEYILQHRPQLKDNSARTYALSLKSLAPPGATDFAWVSDVDYVLGAIEKFKDTTRKNCLNAVIVVLEKGSDAFTKYTEERDKYNQLYAEHNKARKKTESQEKNWVEWPEYLEMVKKLGRETKNLHKDLSKREMFRLQDYLLVLLHSHYPLRNNFADVKVISHAEFKRLTPAQKEEQNYLVQKNKQYSLILNEYKTSKKYGEKTIEMNSKVTPVIRRWLTHNRSGYLLVDSADPSKPLGSNGTSKTFARIGMRELGRRLGSSLLRHSYLSHKYGEDAIEKEKDADLMMHSVAMQDGYIKK